MANKPTKPKGPDAQKDLASLQEAMNKGTIPERKPGEEVHAKTESGVEITIKSEGNVESVPLDQLGKNKRLRKLVRKIAGKIAGKKGGKPVQTEAAALIPPLDGVGRAAQRMVKAVRACDEAAEEKGEAESNLIRALRKSKRTSFKCEGVNLLLSHVGPKDKITIQKPK
jgi:hypothetical protein